VNYLIIYSINRTLLTVAVTVVEVITYLCAPNTLWFLAVDFTIGKLWANSFLATLNTRASQRGRGTTDEGDDFIEEDEPPPETSVLRIAPVTTSMFTNSQIQPSAVGSQNVEMSMISSVASQTESSDREMSFLKVRSPKSEISLAQRAIVETDDILDRVESGSA